MALNVKVGLIGAFDMLKFKNMAKVREQAIQAAPANEISGEFSVNRLAKELHPDFQQLAVTEVIDREEAHAKTFVLSTYDGTPAPYFRAGQYLSLKLDIGDSSLTRPYSISSAPSKALEGSYEITVKENPSGFAADWLLSELKEGDVITASDPQGNFYYEKLRDPAEVIALAGGSGVTPFLSMARAIAEGAEDFHLTLIYACKKQSDVLFEREFNAIAEACPKFKVLYLLESEEKEGYEHGLITAELVKKYAPEGEYAVFVSGPEAMMKYLKQELSPLGLPRRLLRFEMMPVTKNVMAEEGYPLEAVGKTFSLKVRQGDKSWEIPARADEPILAALERAGIKAPSRCRSGECGWCRSKLLSGEFFVPEENEFRRHEDIRFRYIHPCCTFPASDLEIEVPGEYSPN